MTNPLFNIKVGGAHVIGEHAGQGSALVFLHAGVADRRMWREQIAELKDDFHVIAYDRRGFGETSTPDESFSHVNDLKEILDQLGVSSAALIGCSQGGRIAIDFTLAYPQRVTSLVLIAPAISGAPSPGKFSPDIEALLDTLDKAEESEDMERVNAIEANLWLDGPTSPNGRVSGAARELFLDMNAIALNSPDLTKELETPSAYERLGELSLPTLVINGDLDFPFIKERCHYLVETIPNAKGMEIAGTAHLPNLEKPEAVNELLMKFLK
ncbi:MAG TPA: alpha/beta hydrolase [Anaerolineae bacterium]|nr:alpha/beta hydrolase [Anaerolineae bacterium]